MQTPPLSPTQALLIAVLPVLIALVGTVVTLIVGWFKDRDLHQLKKRAIELQRSRLELIGAQFDLAARAQVEEEKLREVVRMTLADASQDLDYTWRFAAVEIKRKRWRTVSVIGVAVAETVLVYFTLFRWFVNHQWSVLSVAMIVIPFSMMVVFYMFDPTLMQLEEKKNRVRDHEGANTQGG